MKGQQYVGKIYTIYNQYGEYSIYAFYTATKVKILAILKEQGVNWNICDEDVSKFCANVYKLYKKQLFQAFSVFESTGRFHKRFYEQLDMYVSKTKFSVLETKQ